MTFVSDYAALPNAGDSRGPFALATFDFTLSGPGSLVTLDMLADSASVDCSGSTASASMGPPIVAVLTDKASGAAAGAAGTAVSNCITNTNTGGSTINCGPVTFRGAISGSALDAGTYTATVRFMGRCSNASTAFVAPVTSTIGLGRGVIVVTQQVP